MYQIVSVVLASFLTAALGVIAALVIKIAVLKKDIRSIRSQMDDILRGDTNAKIVLHGRDKALCEFSAALNESLGVLRQKQLAYVNGDAELKTAMLNAAHDLRTPLTAICGYLDLMSKETNPRKIKEYTEIIKERTQAIKALADELFGYSLALDDSRSSVLQELSLNSLVEECVLDFYEELSSKNITPDIRITDKPVTIYADKRDMTRVVSNLISNAIKHGEGNFAVALDDKGTLTVSNSAPNLTHVDVERMFDRFYTVKNCNYSTGLGLSIAKSLIEKYGGSVNASLNDGIFSVTLTTASIRRAGSPH